MHMKRSFNSVFWFILFGILSINARGQNDYCIIHIVSKGVKSNVYLNDQLIAALDPKEAMIYTVKTRDSDMLKVIFSYNAMDYKWELKLDDASKDNLYFLVDQKGIRSIEASYWKSEDKELINL